MSSLIPSGLSFQTNKSSLLQTRARWNQLHNITKDAKEKKSILAANSRIGSSIREYAASLQRIFVTDQVSM